MVLVTVIFWLAGTYALIGLAFAVAFVTCGIGIIDESALRAPVGLRLILIPGSIALWPGLALKWKRGGQS